MKREREGGRLAATRMSTYSRRRTAARGGGSAANFGQKRAARHGRTSSATGEEREEEVGNKATGQERRGKTREDLCMP